MKIGGTDKVLLLLLSTLLPAGLAFVSRTLRPPGVAPAWELQKSAVSRRGISSSEIDDGSDKNSAEKLLREAVWRATDAVVEAVENGPSFELYMNDTLEKIGQFVEDFDEKYIYKITSATTDYLNSITLGKAGGGKGTFGGSPKDDKPKKEEKEAADSAAPVAASPILSNTSGTVVMSTVTNVTDTAVGAATSEEKKAGSASGTVQLDRPKEVQGVFDELQKKAVDAFKSGPAAAPGEGEASGDPEPDAALTFEEQLESLLKDSKFMPRRLKKEKRAELVKALKALEEVYPGDANPLADPALSGQWSMVYSSSSRMVRRALKGALVALIKASDPRQVIDSGASTVINACRARLRLTPLALRIAQKGSYKSIAKNKVSLEFPRRNGFWRGLFPRLRPGKTLAEVTYLSSRWRICRIGDVMVVFRKVGE